MAKLLSGFYYVNNGTRVMTQVLDTCVIEVNIRAK